MEGNKKKPYDFSKVELHCHLDGCYRVETVAEIAKKRGIEMPSYDPKILKDYITASTRCPSLDDFLDRMGIALKVFRGDADAITRLTKEAVEDKAKDGIKYIEFRYSPHFLASHAKGLPDVSGNLQPKDVVEVVNAALDQASKEHNMIVRTLLCSITVFDWSDDVVTLCQDYKDSGVVGFDTAGPEHGEFPEEVVEAYQAIEELKVERVGHGYHTVDDESVMSLAQEKNIHFEVCPLSSYLTSAVEVPWSQHPAKEFLRRKMNFGINTDDPGVNCFGILRDYEIADKDMGFSLDDLLNCNLKAASSCFLGEEEKQQLVCDLRAEYNRIQTESSWF